MTSRIFSMIVTKSDPHPCLRIWDDSAFILGNQFKPNWTRLMNIHQNSNSLLSIKDQR